MSHLTKGMKFPLTFNGGRVAISEGEKHLQEGIIQIIATGRGEYLLKPDLVLIYINGFLIL